MQPIAATKEDMKNELRHLSMAMFIFKMTKHYTWGADTTQMEAALEVLTERFLPKEIPDQLNHILRQAQDNRNSLMAAYMTDRIASWNELAKMDIRPQGFSVMFEAFNKGAGSEIIAPEKASFKKRAAPRLTANS